MTFVFEDEDCVEGDIQLFLNKDLLSFDDAQVACGIQGGKLAIPSSLEIFQRQLDLIIDNIVASVQVYVGLRDFDDIGGTSGTRFFTIDGELNNLTSVEQGESIWNEGEPSDTQNNENCGTIFLGEGLTDDSCTKAISSMCQRQCSQFFFGDCVDGIQYFANVNVSTFDEAQESCSSQGGKLAIPTSQKRFNEMMQVYNTFLFGTSAFIGLKDFGDVGGKSGGVRFLDVDTNINAFTMLDQSEGIWNNGQPNDSRGEQNCGFCKTGFSIEDKPCETPGESICQRSCGIDAIAVESSPLEYKEKHNTSIEVESATLPTLLVILSIVFAMLGLGWIRRSQNEVNLSS